MIGACPDAHTHFPHTRRLMLLLLLIVAVILQCAYIRNFDTRVYIYIQTKHPATRGSSAISLLPITYITQNRIGLVVEGVAGLLGFRLVGIICVGIDRRRSSRGWGSWWW